MTLINTSGNNVTINIQVQPTKEDILRTPIFYYVSPVFYNAEEKLLLSKLRLEDTIRSMEVEKVQNRCRNEISLNSTYHFDTILRAKKHRERHT